MQVYLHFPLLFPQFFVPLPAKTVAYENNKAFSPSFIGHHDGYPVVRKREVRQGPLEPDR